MSGFLPTLFGLTLALSAALLFSVQPMVAKRLLPLLGGTPAVWNGCLVFFQATLLAAYGYAHLATRRLTSRPQAAIHVGLLLLGLLLLPVGISAAAVRALGQDAHPLGWLFGALLVSVGLPCFAIAATAPLLQNWFAGTRHPRSGDPYFLYAASNAGSLAGLLAYPLLLEPLLPLSAQGRFWTAGYVLLAALIAACGALAWTVRSSTSTSTSTSTKISRFKERDGNTLAVLISRTFRGRPTLGPVAGGDPGRGRGRGAGRHSEQSAASAPGEEAPSIPPTRRQRLRWVALAALPASLMLGTTQYITADIAALPLLWVLPLFLYLVSFILVFARGGERFLPPVLRALPALAVMFALTLLLEATEPASVLIPVHLLVFFAAAVVCHGELARERPPAAALTEYYLALALGGVLGGLFNVLLAPLLFNRLAEYPLALVLVFLLVGEGSGLTPGPSPHTSWRGVTERTSLAVGAQSAMQSPARRQKKRYGRQLSPPSPRSLCGCPRSGRRAGGEAADRAPPLAPGRAARGLPGIHWPDLALPLAIGLVTLALIGLVGRLHLEGRPGLAVMFGIPAVLCYLLSRHPRRFGLGLGALMLAGSASPGVYGPAEYSERSFFGSLRVTRDPTGSFLQLVHGNTVHGRQSFDPRRAGEPLAYYHRSGPAGQIFGRAARREVTDGVMEHRSDGVRAQLQPALDHSGTPLLHHSTSPPRDSPVREVAVVGLGAGALAAYAVPGERWTFYELDPAVGRVARERFTYLRDCRAGSPSLVWGDARLRLRDARERQYGLIVLDAFSSDAVPVHLLTREALRLYRAKLAPGGLLAFHISNRYLDLKPVLAALAADAGLECRGRDDLTLLSTEEAVGKSPSQWVAMAARAGDLGGITTDPRWRPLKPAPEAPVWTDERSDLVSVLKW